MDRRLGDFWTDLCVYDHPQSWLGSSIDSLRPSLVKVFNWTNDDEILLLFVTAANAYLFSIMVHI